MSQDFKDLLEVFEKEKVEYLIVGGYAVIKHTDPRYTKDLDIWVNPSKSNSLKVYKALIDFGAPVSQLTPKDFSQPGYFFTMGIPPTRIDILFDLKGLRFPSSWSKRVRGKLFGMKANFISSTDLLKNKTLVKRHQDLIDVENLKASIKSSRKRRRRSK